MNTRLLAAVLLSVVVIVGVTMWRREARVPVEVDQSNSSVATARTSGTRPAISGSAVRTPAAVTGGLGGVVGEQIRESDRIAAVGQRQLEARYNAETTNPSWADAKQQVLQRLASDPMITEVGAAPQDFVADCRSTACRIEASFANASKANDFFTLYSMVAAPEVGSSSMSSTAGRDGRVQVRIFAAAKQ